METPLTPRQRQILEMLRAGKINKEIANELGIGLGTVKQHVVAVFKKLKVRNRAMAISRSRASHGGGDGESARRLAGEGLLERRPCVVLSIVLPAAASAEAARLFHQTLAAYAFDHDALFLARKGNAGDLIFGVQHPSEHDLFRLLRAAHLVFETLAVQDKALASSLQGGLTAGMAVASMNRHGGWSGEAIASPAIAQARELALAAKPGCLTLSASAQELLLALSPCAATAAAPDFPFHALDRLPWNAGNDQHAPVGRDDEIRRLAALLELAAAGTHRLIYLEGETGMGKSCLCRYLATHCAQARGQAHHFVCGPNGGGACAYALPDGRPTPIDAIVALLEAAAASSPEVIIVDDCHLLPADDLLRLTRMGAQATGKLVLLAARRFPEAAAQADAKLRLGRLTQIATEQLVVRALGSGKASTRAATTAIARGAAGVPLFAVQLARQHDSATLPLPLCFVIGARMDSLGLDRVLLRHVARVAAPLDIDELAGKLGASPADVTAAVAQAIAGGVLKRDDKDRYGFTHPLLRRAVLEAQVE